ncbi:MAG: hypothetical protein DLM69_04810 [Candidatus Chloroheliales bacterium]|nr:MAG: hypothetical protein DLM69_04810 [Chloroflexota bacterium]
MSNEGRGISKEDKYLASSNGFSKSPDLLDPAAHIQLADEAQARADQGEGLTGEQFIAWLQAKTGAAVDFVKEDPADYLELED